MKPWQKRNSEEANLLNPAFLALILQQCVKGYCDGGQTKAPYVLPFLIIPLVLHKGTREALPVKVSTTLSTWITRLQGVHAKIGYAERARSIVPYVKEALIFAFSHNLVCFEGSDSLKVSQLIKVIASSDCMASDEVSECFKKAHFCGRWIARTGKIETAMALLGVKP
ncbi:MAG: three component ABC system middle component [Thermodesulfobacteriota bacterium]|jgi:hypothetical protein